MCLQKKKASLRQFGDNWPVGILGFIFNGFKKLCFKTPKTSDG